MSVQSLRLRALHQGSSEDLHNSLPLYAHVDAKPSVQLLGARQFATFFLRTIFCPYNLTGVILGSFLSAIIETVSEHPHTHTFNERQLYTYASHARRSGFRGNHVSLPQVTTSAGVEIMYDRLIALLFLAQVTFVIANMCLNKCSNSMSVVSMSTFFYCCLTSHIFLALGFHSPVYIAACLLNVLGEFLAIVTGASYKDYPDIFYGSGYGYEDDAGEYCWYLLQWIWEDNARVFACFVLPFVVPALISLSLRVWSWLFPSWPHRMVQEMEEHIKGLEAETLAIKSCLKAEYGWTDEQFERILEQQGDDDGADCARLASVVEERATRREEEERANETMARAEEHTARIRENFARMREREARSEQ